MNREQLERLAKNPNYKLSDKQLAQLQKYRAEEEAHQPKVKLITQEVQPTDKMVTAPQVKRSDNRVSRNKVSTKKLHSEVQKRKNV